MMDVGGGMRVSAAVEKQPESLIKLRADQSHASRWNQNGRPDLRSCRKRSEVVKVFIFFHFIWFNLAFLPACFSTPDM